MATRVRESGGDELLERLTHLDAVYAESRKPTEAPMRQADGQTAVDVDVVIVGGGLWSLLAVVLARLGLRVAVCDRGRAALAHREWNASGPELSALVDAGIVTAEELESLVLARYDAGICRFGGPDYVVRDVLDHAVDAGALLSKGRARAESLGVRFFDGHALVGHATNRDRAVTRFRAAGGDVEFVSHWIVDARGAASPFATADLVCPTVGGVLGGLRHGDAPDEVNSRVGDILVTVDGIDASGRQHVWEGFPGRARECTVYLFYYARRTERVSLLELYARFFEKLATYKRGDPTLVRPTFGFIPGWSRLSPAPHVSEPRISLVGDAAARHSPLTYCGFGAALRSFRGAAHAIHVAIERGESRVGSIVHDAPIHAVTGALAHMLASRALRDSELNDLLDAAFGVLSEMGPAKYAQMLRDEATPGDVVEFLRRTASRHPAVWRKVWRGLGPMRAAKWGASVARSL